MRNKNIYSNNDKNDKKRLIGNDFRVSQQKTRLLWSTENDIIIENGPIENV